MSKVRKILNNFNEHGVVFTVNWLWNCLVFRIIGQRKSIKDFEKITHGKEEKYLYYKENPKVFIVASIPYYDIGGGQRCSQLAKTFNKSGFRVEYLYAYKSGEKKPVNIELPVASHIFIDESIVDKIKDKVSEGDLFIFESPSSKFNDILDLAIEKKCKIIYENIDNWETSLGSEVYNEDTLKRMLSHSDLLVGTAKPLVDQLKEYLNRYKIERKKVAYLANAVDSELFCGNKKTTKPHDLVVGEKTFLYYGSLWGEWFDWDLIIELANSNKNYAVNLIGDYKNIPDIVKRCPGNVHFFGIKKAKRTA